MFQKMRLDVKLIASFMAVALIATIIGIVGVVNLTALKGNILEISNEKLPATNYLSTMKISLEAIKTALRTVLNPGIGREDLQRQFENLQANREKYGAALEAYKALPKAKEEEALFSQFVDKVGIWRTENNKFFDMAKELQKMDAGNPDELCKKIQSYLGDHYKVVAKVNAMISTKKVFDGGTDAATCNFGKWLGGFKTTNQSMLDAMRDVQEPHHRFHATVQKIKDVVAAGDMVKAEEFNTKEMIPALEGAIAKAEVIMAEAEKARSLFDQMTKLDMEVVRFKQKECMDTLDKLIDLNTKETGIVSTNAASGAVKSQFVMVVTIVVGIIIALFLGITIAIGITRPINRIIESLNSGSDQTAAAAGQVSSASQQLSQGATEQASSLEETSSSLDEMSSMTKQNADNAGKANQIAQEARKSADEGNQAMHQMQSAMTTINESSDKIAKIIKTIEEIAFQTNLLALNAAVEAARAGEHGKGFAVVAEEVRNLAKRSATAAKDTAELIEGSIDKVKAGSDIAGKAGKALEDIMNNSKKVADIISEIAAASKEQAEGIGQITNAVAQLDQVTQQNASAAEQSASASEELSSQAEALRGMVTELQQVVDGSSKGITASVSRQVKGPERRAQLAHHDVKVAHINKGGAAKKADVKKAGPKVTKPEEVIPLDEKEESAFKEF